MPLDTCTTRCTLKKRCATWITRTCRKYCWTLFKIWPSTCCASAATKSARKAKNRRKSSRSAAQSALWWFTAQKRAKNRTSPNTRSCAPGCTNASWGKFVFHFVALKSGILASAASPRQKRAQCRRRKKRTVASERSLSKIQTRRQVPENTPPPTQYAPSQPFITIFVHLLSLFTIFYSSYPLELLFLLIFLFSTFSSFSCLPILSLDCFFK